jgi:catechol 2,3-dioxygenase-like lactoylglutathione lyase family enzyme
MPRLAAMSGSHLNLSVSDLDRSVAWYSKVFELVVIGDEKSVIPASEEPMRYRSLGSTESMSYVIGLIQHERRSSDRFDERRPGLDHVGFHVPTNEDLNDWVKHLDALGVEHSGIKNVAYGSCVTIRDPDHIQLELFWANLEYWAGLFISAGGDPSQS